MGRGVDRSTWREWGRVGAGDHEELGRAWFGDREEWGRAMV